MYDAPLVEQTAATLDDKEFAKVCPISGPKQIEKGER
ncbi:unnamed protein product [Gongylonema pulchrum]|uniref:Transcriptional regulator n=1 Tax=Gongylonema pulchrum TaxID=637853 RepID=A0A183DHM6_9BILA|nr:unnamed protein product [Gongylonema pulchrum]